MIISCNSSSSSSSSSSFYNINNNNSKSFSCSLPFPSQQIANGLWPTTWSNLLGVVVVIGAMIYATDNYKLSSLQPFATVLWKLTYLIYLDETYPYNFRLAFISTLAGIVFFIVLLYLRQYTLRMLLAYRGWMCKLKPSLYYFQSIYF